MVSSVSTRPPRSTSAAKPKEVIYTEVMPRQPMPFAAATPATGRRAEATASGTTQRVNGQGRSWSAAPTSGARHAQHDTSTDIGRAAAWLFATVPEGSSRIAAEFHWPAPQGQRSLHLSRRGEAIKLQRTEERGTSGGVTITSNKVLWNGVELPRTDGDVDAASPTEERVNGRLQQALNGLMNRKKAPAAFANAAPAAGTTAPPLPVRQRRLEATVTRAAFQFPPVPVRVRESASQARPEAAGGEVPAQQVARPFGASSLRQAHRLVKAGLPRGFDQVVHVAESRSYRVRVDADRTLVVDAEHAPGRSFVADRKGHLWFDKVPVDTHSDPAVVRVCVERMNAALQAVKRQSDRPAAP